MIPQKKMLTLSTNMQIMVGEAKEDFLILTGEADFLILFMTREEDTQILMSLGSLLVMGVLILRPP